MTGLRRKERSYFTGEGLLDRRTSSEGYFLCVVGRRSHAPSTVCDGSSSTVSRMLQADMCGEVLVRSAWFRSDHSDDERKCTNRITGDAFGGFRKVSNQERSKTTRSRTLLNAQQVDTTYSSFSK